MVASYVSQINYLSHIDNIFVSLQVMRNCPKFGKVILVAMVHELYKSGLGEVTFEKVSAVSFGVLLSSMLVFNIMGVNKI